MRDYLAHAFSVEAQTAELADSERATWIADDSTGTPLGYAMVRRNRLGRRSVGVAPGELQRIYVDKDGMDGAWAMR